jgi:hypothetical protein
MPHPHPATSPLLWHQTPAAQALLADLTPHDLRLTRVFGLPGPDRLDWHPDSDRGAAIFAALEHLRQAAVSPAYLLARDDCARARALAAAQRAPTVSATVAPLFGDPARWLGFGPAEATRRFRANRD